MALIDNYAAASDPRVIAQVTAAIHQEAETVYSEASPPPNHAARATFASKIASGLQNLQPLIMSACSFGALNATSTDTTVSNTVSTLWNLWADA